jgi:hypothetical protein
VRSGKTECFLSLSEDREALKDEFLEDFSMGVPFGAPDLHSPIAD